MTVIRDFISIDGFGLKETYQGVNITEIFIFAKHLRNELSKSSEAIAEYNKYRRMTITGLVLYVGGATGAIALSFVTLSPIGLLLSLPVLYYSMALVQEVIIHYNKSIWLYNRDMLVNGLTKIRK